MVMSATSSWFCPNRGYNAASFAFVWISISLLLQSFVLAKAQGSGAQCSTSPSSLSCTGFGGSDSTDFVYSGNANLDPTNSNTIFMCEDVWYGDRGSSFSALPVRIRASTSSSISFEAAFSFSLSKTDANSGLVFVLLSNSSSNKAVGGNREYAGYGDSGNAFAASIGVEVRATCVAVVSRGRSAHRNCAVSNATLTLPSPIVAEERQYIWVSYTGQTQSLQIFHARDGVKPAFPIVVTTINVGTIIGSDYAYVGFTCGAQGAYRIRSLNFTAVGSLTLPDLPPTTPPPQCLTQPTSLTCPGFAGPEPGFTYNANAFLNNPPAFGIFMCEQAWYGDRGSSFSSHPISLRTLPSPSPIAFEAAFSYSLANQDASSGLVFVIVSNTTGSNTAVGSERTLAGYGDAGSLFVNSIGVELRSVCAAVVMKGRSSERYCAVSNASVAFASPLVPRTRQYVWVSYNGGSKSLHVFLGGNSSTKPATPTIVAKLDVGAIVGGDDAYVGFTCGFQGAYEIHWLDFRAVNPGGLPDIPQTPPPPQCLVQPASLTCPAFAGPEPGFVYNANAFLDQPPDYAIMMCESAWWGDRGSSFSSQPVSLRKTPSSSSIAFEASFTFSLATTGIWSGLVFVIVSNLTGSNKAFGQERGQAGYGDAGSAFVDSVGLELRTGCIAVVSRGRSASRYCAVSNSSLVLASPMASAVKQHVWLSYDGNIKSLQVFFGGSSSVKPITPSIVAKVDVENLVGGDSAFVGFTCGYQGSFRIFSLDFQAVSPGGLPDSPPTTPPPQCLAQPTSLTCPAFAGPEPGFVYNSNAFLDQPPDYAIMMCEAAWWGDRGSSFSSQPVSLRASPASPALAFEVSFTYSLTTADPWSGLVFVIVSNDSGSNTAFGQDRGQAGYGDAGQAFLKSLGLEMRPGCMTIVSRGRSASRYCAVSNATFILPSTLTQTTVAGGGSLVRCTTTVIRRRPLVAGRFPLSAACQPPGLLFAGNCVATAAYR